MRQDICCIACGYVLYQFIQCLRIVCQCDIVHPLIQPLAVMVTQGTVESKAAACVEMGHVGGAV